MLENWLHPVSKNIFLDLDLKDFHFGKKIKIYKSKLPKLKEGQVALIGLDDSSSDAIRRELYLLSYSFEGTAITDLGNVRRTEPDFLLQLFTELLESKIIPVFIGQMPHFALTQYKAHRLAQSAINLALVDESIPYNTGDNEESWLDYILDNSRSKLFNLSIIGAQTHFLPPNIIHHLESRNFECFRLGKVRAEIKNVEPILRNADLLVVNISSLKGSDAPAQSNPSPSGLPSEEACQLTRYAGMSEKLTSAGFYGYRADKDENSQTSKTVAQLIWYFIDGFHNRQNDYPISVDNMVEYVTHIKSYNMQLTFWKSNKTGRWWLQVPKTKKNLQRHRLIPCNYEDYTSAVNEELSERLLNALNKFE